MLTECYYLGETKGRGEDPGLDVTEKSRSCSSREKCSSVSPFGRGAVLPTGWTERILLGEYEIMAQ